MACGCTYARVVDPNEICVKKSLHFDEKSEQLIASSSHRSYRLDTIGSYSIWNVEKKIEFCNKIKIF